MSALETKSVKKVFTKTVVHRALQHKFRNFPQVVCPLTMCDFGPLLLLCVSTFPQKNLTSSFEPLVLSGRDVSEDLLDKSLSILWKLGTLVIPVMGASRSLLATSTALMIRMVFVDPDPGFQPVMMMTGSPFWINPRSIPLWIPL